MRAIKYAVAIGSALVLTAAASTIAQQPRPYDGIDAGIEAYHYHEAQRRAEVDEQLGLKRLLQSYPGLPGPAAGPIYYGGLPLGPLGPAYRAPWSPYSRVWVPPYRAWAPQPIGQLQRQTGPNRWESHPIWEDDPSWKGAAPAEPPSPPHSFPLAPVSPSGPREF